MTGPASDPVLEWYDHTARWRWARRRARWRPVRIWAVTWLAAWRAVRDARRGRAAPAALVTAVRSVLETLVPAAGRHLADAAAETLDRLGRDQFFARRAVACGIDVADRGRPGRQPLA